MAAPSLSFLENPQALLNDLLLRICVELQLDAVRYALAEQHYSAIGRWLEAEDSSVGKYRPMIYSQGSMRLNTTNRPLAGEEYDLDLVCELAVLPRFFPNPLEPLRLIEGRLRQHDTYRHMIEMKNRCVRINYQHNFHLDILPGCHDPSMGGTCIVVPDRKAQDWKESNPKGYAKWFEQKGAMLLPHQKRFILSEAERLPVQQVVAEKSVLALTVQLWKRWRDLRFRSISSLAPVSIVLTTLAGEVYRGEQSLSAAFGEVLAEVNTAIHKARPRLIVPNPSNDREDLSERWDTEDGSYPAFVHTMRDLEAQWKDLLTKRSARDFALPLQKLFGETVAKTVVEKQANDVELARRERKLSVSKTSGAIVGGIASGGIAVPPNTFYGSEN